jgi:hypothetical protein
VVGVDLAATQFTGQPWRWSAATGRRDLSLGGGTSASIADAAEPAGVVGTTQRLDPTGTTLLQTAVRWVGQGAVPLLPGVTDPTSAAATNHAGDTVVYTSSPATGTTASLVPRTGAPEPLPLFAQLQSVVSMNDDRAMVVFSRGPGTIGPGSFSVLRDGQSFDLQLNGVRDFPSCVTSITESGYTATRTVRPVAVNDRDVVVATVDGPDGSVGARGRRCSSPTAGGVDLPVPAGLSDVRALDVNECNVVLGTATRTTPTRTRTVTVVWRPTR